jgi:flagellar hook-length control protein FliK
METGQMNMVQLPIEATLLTTVTGSSQAQPTQAGEQDSSAFAAILGGVTQQALAQSTVLAGAVPAEILLQTGATVEAIPLVVMDVKPETLFTFITTPTLQPSDKVLAEVIPETQLADKVLVKAATPEQSEKDVELKQPEELIPQEMFMNVALAQVVQALQMIGRVPESVQNGDVQVDTVDSVNTFETVDAAAKRLSFSNDSVGDKEFTDSYKMDSGLKTTEMTTMLTISKGSADSAPESIQLPNQEADDTEILDKATVTAKPLAQTVVTTLALSATSTDPPVQAGETSSVGSVRSFGLPTKEEPTTVTRIATATPATVATPATATPQTQAVAQVKVMSQYPATAAPQVQTARAVLAPPEAPPASSVLSVASKPESPASLQAAEEIAPPATSLQHIMEAYSRPFMAVAKTADGRSVVQEEQLQQQTPATADVKSTAHAENVFSGAVRTVATAMTGEDTLSGDKSPSDQTMNGQLQQVLQQRIKTETVAAAPVVTVGTSGVAEQVVKQVSDHFARHEIKTGSEQIVLRLSPENLGELKVNLRMENQRLTVEIVTENRMVRDAILQNSDTLKDSLAKQNIKMDSFNVSSGSNGNDGLAGRNGRNQNEWQELTRNRQATQWLQGEYNLPKDFIPQKLAYNQQTEYGMLNVHY